jgi:hypothetical protein
MIEGRRLPDRRLRLEMLTENQFASGEHATRSLEELFEFIDEYSSVRNKASKSDLSQSISEGSPCPSVSLEHAKIAPPFRDLLRVAQGMWVILSHPYIKFSLFTKLYYALTLPSYDQVHPTNRHSHWQGRQN